MTVDNPIAARRALEALRAGVPNRDAVRALGFHHEPLTERFAERLTAVTSGLRDDTQPTGLLFAAEFGGGKSHCLEYLRDLALHRGFAVSRVVVSKETQMFDPLKVFSAAVDSLTVPDRVGTGLGEIAFSHLSDQNPRFAEFLPWLGRSGLNACFDATMYLHREAAANEELQDRLIQFWNGGPLRVAELRRDLRSCAPNPPFRIERIGISDLARQRFKFTARLLHAAGYEGWLLLIDELELIGRYSVLQRGRSYAELSRLLGLVPDQAVPGLLTVGAITSDYDTEILHDKKDLYLVAPRFRARGDAESELTAALAERAMIELSRSCLRLPEPDTETLIGTQERLSEVYEAAYGIRPATPSDMTKVVGGQMREYIRSWITKWDLQRLDPGYEPVAEVERIHTDYAEDELLEHSGGNGEDDT